MTSLPDKHFRDHLEHFKKSPPPQAWSRVESGLNKNKSKTIWLSVAATIVVLVSASILLWHSGATSKNLSILATNHIVKSESNYTPIAATTTQINESTTSASIKPAKTIHNSSEKPIAVDKQNSLVQELNVAQEEVIEEVPGEKSIANPTAVEINSSSAPESIVVNENNSTTLRSNKITYSSGEVNSRFLKKDSTSPSSYVSSTPSIPPHPSPEKTETPIQKLLDIASVLKSEDASLGDLREIKNEYLSLPLKTQTKDK